MTLDLRQLLARQEKAYAAFKNSAHLYVGKEYHSSGVKRIFHENEYQTINQNLIGNKKDRRRFNTDPNKLVIEKNFFLNYLKASGKHFMFRPLKRKEMYIKRPETWDFEEKHNTNHFFAYLSVSLGIFLMFYLFLQLSNVYHWYLLQQIVLVVTIILFIFFRKRQKRWMSNFHERIARDPRLFLSKEAHSYDTSDDYKALCFFHVVEGSDWFLEKQAEIFKLQAGIENSRVSYLWNINSNDVFDLEYQHFQRPNFLKFVSVSDNLVPVIETKYSFIFDLKEFDMEHYLFEDTLFTDYISCYLPPE